MSEADIPTPEILEAALEAFAEFGYDGASVREIARSLGGSHNLIPNRIGTKEELWYEAVGWGASRMFSVLATTFSEGTLGSDMDRMRALVTRFIEANLAQPALARVIAQEASTPGPRIDHLYDRWIRPFSTMGADLLASLRASGQVSVDSVGLVYFFMAFGGGGASVFPALAGWLGNAIDPHDSIAVRAYAEQATSLIFDGLVSRD